mmetsp:Transcript_24554/g.38088  ORF Transcript_24554/g.38088 Transcript_24554/m.38088 type:complete len:104 (-) Transcript_24554:1837-2148(-)
MSAENNLLTKSDTGHDGQSIPTMPEQDSSFLNILSKTTPDPVLEGQALPTKQKSLVRQAEEGVTDDLASLIPKRSTTQPKAFDIVNRSQKRLDDYNKLKRTYD